MMSQGLFQCTKCMIGDLKSPLGEMSMMPGCNCGCHGSNLLIGDEGFLIRVPYPNIEIEAFGNVDILQHID